MANPVPKGSSAALKGWAPKKAVISGVFGQALRQPMGERR
jgi:hypothetical protein